MMDLLLLDWSQKNYELEQQYWLLVQECFKKKGKKRGALSTVPMETLFSGQLLESSYIRFVMFCKFFMLSQWKK